MCGWNTTHSTSYHAAWTVDPSYNLERVCPTHELVLARKSSALPASSSRAPSGTVTSSEAPATNTAAIMNILYSFEDNVTTAEEQALIESVKVALRLN